MSDLGPEDPQIEESTAIGGITGSSDQSQKTFLLMQEFMLKKGLIAPGMNEIELQEFLAKEQTGENPTCTTILASNKRNATDMDAGITSKNRRETPVIGRADTISSASEVTIYKKAIRQVDPELESKIEQLLNNSRKQFSEETDANPSEKRKVSYSSDEMMDTSDETVELNNPFPINSFTGNVSGLGQILEVVQPLAVQQEAVAGLSKITPEEQAEQIIKDSEHSRAQLMEVPGNETCINNQNHVNVMTIDKDYQMIDAHIDETMWKKILSFEYIDFGKLVVKNKPYREEEHQRLEIVNKNGYSFLSPVSDRETHQINSYVKWEQAFRVYSNVIMTQYPNKATELLQYNHTIHTAVMSYSWENIYSYNREFRQHIGRHPQRPWNVILQQAWTMLLKDRLKYDNMAFQRGGTRSSKKDKEPCRRFNRGKCMFVLSGYHVNLIITAQ